LGKVNRPVGKLQPNAWGLYDTLGTLWECCLDWYVADLGTAEVIEPVGPVTGEKGRAIRAGCYSYSSNYSRAASRHGNSNVWAVENGLSGVRLIAPVGLKWPTTADNRMLTATYSLDEEKIVTVDIQTNRTGTATSVEEDWVSISERNFTDVFGDVNRKVAADGDKRVYWRADESWPGHYFANGTIRMVVKKWDVTNPPDYLVIDLRSDDVRGTAGSRELYYASADALPDGGLANRKYKKDFLVMRRIPAQGVKWCMGSPSGESGRVEGVETQHYVTFTQEDFYCAIYPVTCGQLAYLGDSTNWKQWSQFYDMDLIDYTPPPMRGWQQIRGKVEDGYDWPSNGHAVDSGSHLGVLSTLDGGRDFDIPTDAQWEFICRAGKSGTFGNGTVVNDCGWWDGNSGKKGHEVGLKPANDWGIYDLHGNFWELVLDWYAGKTADAETDPYGPLSGTSRVWRGGQAAYAWTYGRCASRYGGSLSYCNGLYGAFRPITPISGKWPNGGRVLPAEEE
ncbi:MAG: SUMF1/EgtB/PvdO family nonheme iron enzyme, partial [bacterium]|nr:SUMF1/EgtB/PvdO family nonheme iron enzyme [Candidatus Colisoma equi]